jgi:hypothetical protein
MDEASVASTPESRLFGAFFRDIDGCRRLMKATGAVVACDAVLHAILRSPSWAPQSLVFFFPKDISSDDDVAQWVRYFGNEGYTVAEEEHAGFGYRPVCCVY